MANDKWKIVLGRPTPDTLNPKPSRHLMNETNHFFNLGYGWLCKHCSAEDAERHEQRTSFWSLFHKAPPQPEQKSPKLPSLVLARWTDPTRQTLACPRCSIEEPVSRA